MNSAASFSTPPEEEGPCGDWTYHEWAEAFSTNDLARALPPGHIAVCRVQTGGRGRFNRSRGLKPPDPGAGNAPRDPPSLPLC